MGVLVLLSNSLRSYELVFIVDVINYARVVFPFILVSFLLLLTWLVLRWFVIVDMSDYAPVCFC